MSDKEAKINFYSKSFDYDNAFSFVFKIENRPYGFIFSIMDTKETIEKALSKLADNIHNNIEGVFATELADELHFARKDKE